MIERAEHALTFESLREVGNQSEIKDPGALEDLIKLTGDEFCGVPEGFRGCIRASGVPPALRAFYNKVQDRLGQPWNAVWVSTTPVLLNACQQTGTLSSWTIKKATTLAFETWPCIETQTSKNQSMPSTQPQPVPINSPPAADAKTTSLADLDFPAPGFSPREMHDSQCRDGNDTCPHRTQTSNENIDYDADTESEDTEVNGDSDAGSEDSHDDEVSINFPRGGCQPDINDDPGMGPFGDDYDITDVARLSRQSIANSNDTPTPHHLSSDDDHLQDESRIFRTPVVAISTRTAANSGARRELSSARTEAKLDKRRPFGSKVPQKNSHTT